MFPKIILLPGNCRVTISYDNNHFKVTRTNRSENGRRNIHRIEAKCYQTINEAMLRVNQAFPSVII